MKLGKYLVFVIAGLFFLINGVLFAQETPEQKQVEVTQEKEEVKAQPVLIQEEKGAERPQFQEKPKIRGYTYNLERLIKEAQENIKKVEAKVTEHFEKGNQLSQEGRLKEARQEWQRALEISQDPEMKNYIREREKRAREEELTRQKEEQERQKRFKAEAKEKERLAKETERKKKEEELAKQKAEQQQRLAEEKAKKEQELKSRQEELARQKEKQLKQIAEEKARRKQEGKETKLKEQRK